MKKHIPMRRAHVMKLCHFDFHVFFPRFMLFPTFSKTYKTHKGNRTHETTYVCVCVDINIRMCFRVDMVWYVWVCVFYVLVL